MNIWLVTIGEPIPHDRNQLRLHRTGIIANLISSKTNHNITWWTSDFNHFEKSHIYGRDMKIKIADNYNLVVLHGRGYKRNISIDRIIDHKEIAIKFKSAALEAEKPDIIVAAFPTLGLCEECIILGKKWNIPVLIDYRDMWPEVFLEIVPKFLKPIFRIPLMALFYRTKKLFGNASGLIGITEEFLKLGLDKIKRKVNQYDAVFPLAYLQNQFSESDLVEANTYWNTFLPRTNKLRIIFIGTLGYQFDLETIVKALEILNSKGINNFEVILCGSGDKERYLKDASLKFSNLYLPGYITAAKIKSLLLTADIGLCPYNVNQAFLSSIPGKAIEYMSAGLPILTTLEDGELGKISKNFNFGYFYSERDGESLAKAIENLNKKKGKLNSNRLKILELYTKNFDADNVYMSYIKKKKKIVN